MTQRPDIKRFADKPEATERTIRALSQAGFTVTVDAPSPVRSAFHNSMGEVEIVGEYQDPQTGNQVKLGMNIVTRNFTGPFNWAAEATLADADTGSKPLAHGGNHDNSQSEVRDQLVTLLGAARFGVEAGRLPTWTPEYEAFREETRAQLDPLYADAGPNQTS